MNTFENRQQGFIGLLVALIAVLVIGGGTYVALHTGMGISVPVSPENPLDTGIIHVSTSTKPATTTVPTTATTTRATTTLPVSASTTVNTTPASSTVQASTTLNAQ